jgi:hypothetical protein
MCDWRNVLSMSCIHIQQRLGILFRCTSRRSSIEQVRKHIARPLYTSEQEYIHSSPNLIKVLCISSSVQCSSALTLNAQARHVMPLYPIPYSYT